MKPSCGCDGQKKAFKGKTIEIDLARSNKARTSTVITMKLGLKTKTSRVRTINPHDEKQPKPDVGLSNLYLSSIKNLKNN